MKIVYAGTPEFAVAPLQSLIEHPDYDVVAVYTQPDRPAGRGRKLQASPVKQLAVEHNIVVEQPVTLKDAEAQQRLQSFQADCMIVAAYGLLLPQVVLDMPRLGCLNIHASLLPRWRGAAPIQRAIQAGDRLTGVTIMQMSLGLDTGDMLAKSEVVINDDETASTLHDKLAISGASLLMQSLPEVFAGTIQPQQQDDALSTYAKKLNKKEALIDWSRSAIDICADIRAFNPWPVAYSQREERTIRLWQATIAEERVKQRSTPGEVIAEDRDKGLLVACGCGGAIWLQKIQLPGKKAMAVSELLNSQSFEGQLL